MGDIGQEQQHIPIGTQALINPFGGGATSVTAGGNEGPYYVMMAPGMELTQASSAQPGRRKSGGMTVAEAAGGQRAQRDEKRRATHNEVERRRRDKINNWIMRLAKVVPDCTQDHTKQGQSKGGILAKACEHIADLTSENSRLSEIHKDNEVLSVELDSVRQQLHDAKAENRKLKALLQRHGIQDLDSNAQ